MPALSEIQAAFGRALLGGDEAPAATMVAGDGLSPAARIEIYRHHVFTTLTAALASTYPVVCRLVDERFFGYAADAYIRRHPPAGPCLFEFGESLASFLEEFEPSRHLAYLPDVARLEWALNAAAHAEDAEPIEPAALGQVAEGELAQLRLRLHPSVQLLVSTWPIGQIWLANQPDADPELSVDLGSGGVRIEVRRVDTEPVFRAVGAGTFAFRSALLDGRALEEAAAAALDADEAFDLAQDIAALFGEQLLVGFSSAPVPSV